MRAKTVVFEDGTPDAREVDKLSAGIETLCCDWHRMRSVIERIARSPWWDLRTLCCRYCHAPFVVSDGECHHEEDCVYQRCCEIVGAEPVPLPNQAVLDEWRHSASNLSI